MSRGNQQSVRSPEYGQLIELLINARLSSGLTKKEICDRLGKPKNYILKVEKGERRVDVVEFFDLCEAMEANAGELLKTFSEFRMEL